MVSRLKNENAVELLGYCVDGFRVLAYEYAANGSLHDILHGQSLQIILVISLLAIATNERIFDIIYTT